MRLNILHYVSDRKNNMLQKILLVKNILTPYRAHFFKILEEDLRKKDIEITVVVTAAREKNRSWKYKDYDLQFTKLLKGFTLTMFNRYLHFGFGLKKITDEINPDLVILAGYYFQPNNLFILLNKNNFNRKYIFWSESNTLGLDTTSSFLKVPRTFIRNFVYKKVDGFMSPGIHSDKFILKLSNNQPIIRIPNLVDDERFLKISSTEFNREEFKQNYLIGTYKFVLFTTARLELIKGILEMIVKISNSVYREEIIYVIAGSGSKDREIREISKNLKVNIRLVGYLTEVDLVKFHIISYCFILPSLVDPSPLSVIEALWLSKPLLLSKFVGNAPEALIDDKNGYLIDMETSSSFEIDKLLSLNKLTYENFCLKSLNIAKTKFNSKIATGNFVKELMTFYDGLL